jgi:hypothetical protein
MKGINNEISHTAGLKHSKTLPKAPVRVVAYTMFEANADPYATFQFFYRSKEVLSKFNFRGWDKTHSPQTSKSTPQKTLRRSNRLRGKDLAFETPLSIKHRAEAKKNLITESQKVKERLKKSNKKLLDDQPQFNFMGPYRVTPLECKPKGSKRGTHSPSSSSSSVAIVESSADEGIPLHTRRESLATKTSKKLVASRTHVDSTMDVNNSTLASDEAESTTPKQIDDSHLSYEDTPKKVGHFATTSELSQSLVVSTKKVLFSLPNAMNMRELSSHASDADDEKEDAMSDEEFKLEDGEVDAEDEEIGDTQGDDEGIAEKILDMALGKRGRDEDDDGGEDVEEREAGEDMTEDAGVCYEEKDEESPRKKRVRTKDGNGEGEGRELME